MDENVAARGSGSGLPERLWLVGPCEDWLASAVIDHGLAVGWVPSVEQWPVEVERGAGGIAVLSGGADVIGVTVELVRLAPSWTVIRDMRGWGGRRIEREAAAALGAMPDARFVPVPTSPWTAKARSANVQTREALREILVALGLGTAKAVG